MIKLNELILILLTVWFSDPALAGVQSFKTAKRFKHSKGAEIRFLATPSEHQTRKAFVGHLRVPSKGKVPFHQDATEEYLFILQGHGKIWIDGKMHEIKAKDTVFMPAGAKVRFENSEQPLEALQIFAEPGPETKYQAKSWKPAPSVKSKKKAE